MESLHTASNGIIGAGIGGPITPRDDAIPGPPPASNDHIVEENTQSKP